MNMHLRERRSHAREFIEVPASLRGLINNVIEDLKLICDELDGDGAESVDGSPPDFDDKRRG